MDILPAHLPATHSLPSQVQNTEKAGKWEVCMGMWMYSRAHVVYVSVCVHDSETRADNFHQLSSYSIFVSLFIIVPHTIYHCLISHSFFSLFLSHLSSGFICGCSAFHSIFSISHDYSSATPVTVPHNYIPLSAAARAEEHNGDEDAGKWSRKKVHLHTGL